MQVPSAGLMNVRYSSRVTVPWQSRATTAAASSHEDSFHKVCAPEADAPSDLLRQRLRKLASKRAKAATLPNMRLV